MPHLRLVHDRRDAPDAQARPPGDSPVTDSGDERLHFDAEEEPPESDDEPPDDDARARRARRVRLARQTVVALVAFQFLAVLHDVGRTWQYLRADAVAPPAWLALPACLGLWLATAWLALGRARGGTRAGYLVCAAALALAVPFFGLASALTWPFEMGATLALAGAWLVHREQRSHVEAQP